VVQVCWEGLFFNVEQLEEAERERDVLAEETTWHEAVRNIWFVVFREAESEFQVELCERCNVPSTEINVEDLLDGISQMLHFGNR
jgi:hypothetical protein